MLLNVVTDPDTTALLAEIIRPIELRAVEAEINAAAAAVSLRNRAVGRAAV